APASGSTPAPRSGRAAVASTCWWTANRTELHQAGRSRRVETATAALPVPWAFGPPRVEGAESGWEQPQAQGRTTTPPTLPPVPRGKVPKADGGEPKPRIPGPPSHQPAARSFTPGKSTGTPSATFT